MRRRLPAFLVSAGCGLAALACAAPPAPLATPALAPAGLPARSAHGMVVSGSPIATGVGVRVLEEGGSAVDAAIATAFALAVVEPSQSGIGGRTQLLLREAGGLAFAIDGTTEVPVAYPGGPVDDEDAYGYATVAIPGTVAALSLAARRHGTWPLERVMQPAIRLARDGFPLSASEADRFARTADRLREFPGSRALFLRADGSAYVEGDRFRQPELAATLGAIAARGEQAFYRGEIADRMAADIAANGGWVTSSGLAAYRAEESIVVRGEYRGHELIGSYLPASGATTIEILQILDRFDLASIAGAPAWLDIVARALLIGFEDREADVMPAARKANWLVSPQLADERASRLRGPAGGARAGRGPGGGEPEHTTHVSVADRRGNVVALTQSVGPLMGSKVATPGLGFVYAATMGYLGELEPGTRRHWSSQSPLIVVRDGRPSHVLGAAGSRRILSAIVQTLSRAIDQRLPLDAAIAAPRFHPTPGRIDVEVRPGAAWPDPDIARLRASGLRIQPRDDAPYFARVNAIAWDPVAREWIGVADTRWPGAAGAPAR